MCDMMPTSTTTTTTTTTTTRQGKAYRRYIYIQGVAVGDRTYLGIYASKYYGVSQT